jgi:stromal membrane-associated protein
MWCVYLSLTQYHCTDCGKQPLKKVQENIQIERSASQRLASPPSQPTRQQAPAQPPIDLFGDDSTPAPPRANTGPPAERAVPPKAEPAQPKQTKAGDSLLGLDFLGGGASTAPARPSSTGPASAAPSRPDLKQSILSLYAAKPAAASPIHQQHARQDSFGGLTSPGVPQAQQPPQPSGLNDAFSSLSFAAQPAAPAPKPSPFAGLDSFSSARSPPSTSSSNMFGGGGSFFDTKPKPAPPQRYTQPQPSTSSGFGDFSSFTSPAAPSKQSAPASGMTDLLDLSMSAAPAPSNSMASPHTNNAFNLSSPAPPPVSKPAPAPTYSGFGNMDAWGGNDVWASSAPSQPAAPTVTATHAYPKSPGWGNTAQATQDDDFGGWSSAAPTTTTTTHTNTNTSSTTTKPASGFGGGDDLFSNVWE